MDTNRAYSHTNGKHIELCKTNLKTGLEKTELNYSESHSGITSQGKSKGNRKTKPRYTVSNTRKDKLEVINKLTGDKKHRDYN